MILHCSEQHNSFGVSDLARRLNEAKEILTDIERSRRHP